MTLLLIFDQLVLALKFYSPDAIYFVILRCAELRDVGGSFGWVEVFLVKHLLVFYVFFFFLDPLKKYNWITFCLETTFSHHAKWSWTQLFKVMKILWLINFKIFLSDHFLLWRNLFCLRYTFYRREVFPIVLIDKWAWLRWIQFFNLHLI